LFITVNWFNEIKLNERFKLQYNFDTNVNLCEIDRGKIRNQ